MTFPVRAFPGAERVLAAQSAMLPQPDQLCGPVAGRAALHAVLGAAQVPSLVTLALSSGTAVWPEDVPQWRPAGSASHTTGWTKVPRADSPAHSGTTAAGLARALSATGVEVVSVPAVDEARLSTLLGAVAGAAYPIGVVANLRTGPVLPPGATSWDVGHFVVLWGVSDDGRVALGDSYAELGASGLPPGCRLVTASSLSVALLLPPGRGLLLLCRPEDRAALGDLVGAAALTARGWDQAPPNAPPAP